MVGKDGSDTTTDQINKFVLSLSFLLYCIYWMAASFTSK